MAAKEKTKKTRSKKPKRTVTRGKRKEAIARATIQEGNGTIRVNGATVSSLNSPVIRQIITEPLHFFEKSNDVDVNVNVRGGGAIGQAQAARTAIARALLKHSKDEKMKKEMIEFDRSLLVEDSRRVEPKKFKGPKARARFTKSYR